MGLIPEPTVLKSAYPDKTSNGDISSSVFKSYSKLSCISFNNVEQEKPPEENYTTMCQVPWFDL